MKKIIDVSEPADEGFALTLIDKTMAQYPNQEVGSRGTMSLRIRDKTYLVTKNKDSYTVEEGASKGEKVNLGGL